MKRFNIILLLLLCVTLAGVLFLRWQTKEEPAVPVIAEAVPTETPAPTPPPVPTPTPAPTPSPVPTPEPTAFLPPRGYTEESYNLVSDMVYAYADRQEAALDIIRSDLERLTALDPALGSLWAKLMRTWSEVNSELVINPGVLPDGLPEDESLCIVVLGFQLESDGSMAPELSGRCETALKCAEKYPDALIAVTGGGTACPRRQRRAHFERGRLPHHRGQRGVYLPSAGAKSPGGEGPGHGVKRLPCAAGCAALRGGGAAVRIRDGGSPLLGRLQRGLRHRRPLPPRQSHDAENVALGTCGPAVLKKATLYGVQGRFLF